MSLSINLNPFLNTSSNLKSNFISNYAQYAESYDNIDLIGNQKFNTQWPILVAIIMIVIAIILFIYTQKEKDIYGKELERPTLKKILYNLALVLLVGSIFGFGYGTFLYLAVYLPEYYKWFNSLPPSAKANISMIYAIDKIETSTKFKN